MIDRRTSWAVVVALVVLGAAPACGGDDDGDTVPPPPPCPTDPPASGAACANEGQACTWVRCATTGRSNAQCSAGAWRLDVAPCAPQTCLSSGTSCEAEQICVERRGGALLVDCAVSPCGEGPVEAACACALCAGAPCTVSGTTVICNTCTSGLCP